MKTLNIYIIDDEAPILEMFKEFFTMLGHNVRCNESSLQAYKEIVEGETTYDLIISDVYMNKPDYDGIEFAQLMMKDRPEIPIILITGFARFQNINLPGNIKDLFLKPFPLHKISQRIEELFEV